MRKGDAEHGAVANEFRDEAQVVARINFVEKQPKRFVRRGKGECFVCAHKINDI